MQEINYPVSSEAYKVVGFHSPEIQPLYLILFGYKHSDNYRHLFLYRSAMEMYIFTLKLPAYTVWLLFVPLCYPRPILK